LSTEADFLHSTGHTYIQSVKKDDRQNLVNRYDQIPGMTDNTNTFVSHFSRRAMNGFVPGLLMG